MSLILEKSSSQEEDFQAIPLHMGEGYIDVLRRVHQVLEPRTYLEVGTDTGHSLALARCPSIAIDPEFRIDREVIGTKPSCFLFNCASDDYFRRYDTKMLLGDDVDMAFLDGMHHFEFLLRDFMNVEKLCRRNSIVFMHDCLPTDAHVARRYGGDPSLAERSANPDWWAGDVWKTARALVKHRPDLRIHAVDAHPTGLLAITNLDPSSNVLAKAYFDIVDEAHALPTTRSVLKEHAEALGMRPASTMMESDSLKRLFWL